jgi:hypothetical protein
MLEAKLTLEAAERIKEPDLDRLKALSHDRLVAVRQAGDIP